MSRVIENTTDKQLQDVKTWTKDEGWKDKKAERYQQVILHIRLAPYSNVGRTGECFGHEEVLRDKL